VNVVPGKPAAVPALVTYGPWQALPGKRYCDGLKDNLSYIFISWVISQKHFQVIPCWIAAWSQKWCGI